MFVIHERKLNYIFHEFLCFEVLPRHEKKLLWREINFH